VLDEATLTRGTLLFKTHNGRVNDDLPRELLIRDARPDDLDAVSAVIREAYAQYQKDYPPESWGRFYQMIGEVRGHAGRAEIIVAERDREIVGSATFYEDGRLSGQGEWPEGWSGILRLAVRPNQRGRGTGRTLLEECIRRSREPGVYTIGLHTTDWMAVARDMYERRGFVRVPEFDFVPRSGINAYGYKLDIDPSTV
jgi:ribosomal protein S18 acetylase RimI-like enzyme